MFEKNEFFTEPIKPALEKKQVYGGGILKIADFFERVQCMKQSLRNKCQ